MPPRSLSRSPRRTRPGCRSWKWGSSSLMRSLSLGRQVSPRVMAPHCPCHLSVSGDFARRPNSASISLTRKCWLAAKSQMAAGASCTQTFQRIARIINAITRPKSTARLRRTSNCSRARISSVGDASRKACSCRVNALSTVFHFAHNSRPKVDTGTHLPLFLPGANL